MSSKETYSGENVRDSFSLPRMEPFLQEANNDVELALELYAWNAQMAAAALEQISYLEVLLRNTIDRQLAKEVKEDKNGIPWFLLHPYNTVMSEAVETVRTRLRGRNQETRDQIVAGLSFGYWSGWLGKNHEDLWRRSLRLAFPNNSVRRKDVSVLVERVRKFRNRIAHHDSLLRVDIGFEMDAVFKLAEAINADSARWMRSVDRTVEVGRRKPIQTPDTVVVPATDAWPFYEENSAYICQAGRYFQEVKYIAFYADKEIKPSVPCVVARYDNVEWNLDEANRLVNSGNRDAKKLGHVMRKGLEAGWQDGRYQVFILTREGDPKQVSLSSPLVNERTGKGSAFVRRQRYTSVHQLRLAQDIWEL